MGVLTVFLKGPCRVLRSARELGQLCALSFLLTGCGLGEGQVAPVNAKELGRATCVTRTNDVDTF